MTIEILRRASNQSVIVTISGSKTYIYREVNHVDIRRSERGLYLFSFVGKLANDSQNRKENVSGVAGIYREVLE